MAIQITASRLLVVEGKDEQLFFEALMQHLGLQNIQIMPIGGKTRLRDNLKALVIAPGFSGVVSLGVVRDADDNPTAAFQSVHDALEAANLPAPTSPLSPTVDSPQVTVMILPAAHSTGALEDLCLQSTTQDPATICVEQYFQCLQQQGLPAPQNLAKARIQVFLASRQEPGKRLGEAAQKGYWAWGDNAFDEVKDFLQQVSV